MFPDGAHDDQIDAVSGAIAALAHKTHVVIDAAAFGALNDSLRKESSWSDAG